MNMYILYLGRLLTSLKKSIVNLFGPLLPLRALNPSNGTLDVPVTNYMAEITPKSYM